MHSHEHLLTIIIITDLCFRQAVDTETAPVSNERKQIDIVDRIAVDINTITTNHKYNICNISH